VQLNHPSLAESVLCRNIINRRFEEKVNIKPPDDKEDVLDVTQLVCVCCHGTHNIAFQEYSSMLCGHVAENISLRFRN